jgi:hypothetical protein
MISSFLFEEVTVELGGQQYESCTFRRCEMVMNGRPPHLVGCRFEDCRWSFDGPAGVSLEFFQMLVILDPGVRAGFAKSVGFEDKAARPTAELRLN